jgi:polyhydroxyalkanoate synthase
MRIQVDPRQAMKEFGDFTRRLQQGRELLEKTRDKDVQIATTPKREVWRQDKTVLYHYTPMAKKKTVSTPVLVVYGLVGRYTMADLQEDRSLIRNLLLQGVDLYVVDWGNPTRGDRWLTLEDYIDGYLGECVDFIRNKHKLAAISLLGICEGGVFTTCYAARNPKKVKSLALTITPIDFHADQSGGPPEHGFINLWTRSLTKEDIDRLIEANGNLPGELMSHVFSQPAQRARSRPPSAATTS